MSLSLLPLRTAGQMTESHQKKAEKAQKAQKAHMTDQPQLGEYYPRAAAHRSAAGPDADRHNRHTPHSEPAEFLNRWIPLPWNPQHS